MLDNIRHPHTDGLQPSWAAYLVHVPPLHVGITKTELDHSLQHNTAVDMTAMLAACTTVAVVKHTLSDPLIWIKV